jgi:hypothetical protein
MLGGLRYFCGLFKPKDWIFGAQTANTSAKCLDFQLFDQKSTIKRPNVQKSGIRPVAI